MPTNELVVLLVRHGERQDEAPGRLGSLASIRRTLTLKERLDPPLTEVGQDQAMAAFTKIKPHLKNQKVLVCTSPLKRTIGTAAMMGALVWPKTTEFVGGTTTTVNNNDNNKKAAILPIVVMNGLCDCAAHVQILGGANQTVSSGLVDGAAMPMNDASPESPVLKMMTGMNLVQRFQTKIQLFKEDEENGEGDLLPMSGFIESDGATSTTTTTTSANDLTLQWALSSTDAATTTTTDQNDAGMINYRKAKMLNGAFDATLNRCVKLAMRNDCTVCIVVTHREGIRNHVQDITRNTSRISTPYCCIGSFLVAAAAADGNNNDHGGNSHKLQWTLKDVTPYEQFKWPVAARRKSGR